MSSTGRNASSPEMWGCEGDASCAPQSQTQGIGLGRTNEQFICFALTPQRNLRAKCVKIAICVLCGSSQLCVNVCACNKHFWREVCKPGTECGFGAALPVFLCGSCSSQSFSFGAVRPQERDISHVCCASKRWHEPKC